MERIIFVTGMGFTAVAGITEWTWTACAEHDRIDFGIKPGDELELGITICNDIRQHHQPVVFGHANEASASPATGSESCVLRKPGPPG